MTRTHEDAPPLPAIRALFAAMVLLLLVSTADAAPKPGTVRRGEELQVAQVVRGRAAALRRDRPDELVPLPERRDDDRLLHHRAPRLQIREAQAPGVLLDIL